MEEGGEMDVDVAGGKLTSTLLHIAVRKKDFGSVCEFLGDIGYDVNTRDSYNNTPLHVAAECECLDILNLLLSRGGSVSATNNLGETPMHKAATSTTSEVVESLLKSGASVNIYNKEGFTPFHIAVSKGYKKVIELMLDWGAQVHSLASQKQTPLHIAAMHWNCILAEILVDRGANVNARDCEGKTPLHVAVGRVDITMTELLIERGADISAPDFEGQTPLHLAANHWNYRIVKILLDKGALINTQNIKGHTALHIAVNNGDLTLVNRLLDRGALTDTIDRERLTPLQCSVNKDYAKVMLKLLSKGADISVFDDSYITSNYFDSSPCCGPIMRVLIFKAKWLKPNNTYKVEPTDEYSQLKDKCLQELEIIRRKIVVDISGNEYSLIQIFDENRQDDKVFYKLVEGVLISPNLDTEFPLYAFFLKLYLLRMKKRHLLICKAKIFFLVHNIFDKSVLSSSRYLPECILTYLSYIDLQNLIVVAEDSIRNKNKLSW